MTRLIEDGFLLPPDLPDAPDGITREMVRESIRRAGRNLPDAPDAEWRGKWDNIGSREARLRYLETYWPELLASLSPPSRRRRFTSWLLGVVAWWRRG